MALSVYLFRGSGLWAKTSRTETNECKVLGNLDPRNLDYNPRPKTMHVHVY